MTAPAAAAAYQELAAAVRGDLIMPADPGYDQTRAVYNAMIDKHPAAVVRCRDTADVITCVRFARAHGVQIAVRGGGHNAAGLGVWDDALVIDLSLMRSITVSPGDRTVRADAGCTWGDVDHATAAFGLATPSGLIASTGVADLTLGGGIGYLSRRFGLTVDNLLAADVVLADGTFVTARADCHGDLFWARRGRELRRRHLVYVRLPRHRRARHDHRRPGLLRLRRHRRGDGLVPGTAALAARGAERLVRPGRHLLGPARLRIPVEHARRPRRRLSQDPRPVRRLALAGSAHRRDGLRRSGHAAIHGALYRRIPDRLVLPAAVRRLRKAPTVNGTPRDRSTLSAHVSAPFFYRLPRAPGAQSSRACRSAGHDRPRTTAGTPNHERPGRSAGSARRRLERHGVFISHITISHITDDNNKPTEIWRKS